MRLTPVAHHRVLSFARHATIAAGLGLGWLLLGGSSASAASDPAPALPITAPPAVSAPASAVLAPASAVLAPASAVLDAVPHAAVPLTAPVTRAVPIVQDLPQAVPQLQTAATSAVQGTTTTLGQAVDAVPAVAAPVLQGPLEPLNPLVGAAASSLGQAVTTAGGGVSDTLSAPVPVALPDPLPSLASAPLAPAADPGAAVPGDQTSPDGAAFADSATIDPAAWGQAILAGLGPDWSYGVLPAAAALEELGTETQAPAGTPPLPQPDVPLPAPFGAASSGGSWAPSGPAGTATLAAAFLLAPLFMLLGRTRPARGLVPSSPAFDPGSTPD